MFKILIIQNNIKYTKYVLKYKMIILYKLYLNVFV